MYHFRMWLSVALLVLVLSAVCNGAGEVAISAPDIYPIANEPIVGEVTVKIVAQARDAVVRFTLDGRTPTNVTGQDYREPIRLFEPGTYIIKAIAISNVPGRADSVVSKMTYVILKSNVAVPEPVPQPTRKFRGSVRIALTTTEPDPVELQYVIDIDDPGNRWQPYSGPIIIDTPGTHVLQTRAAKKSSSGTMEYSPAGRFSYVLTPPMRYDVLASCKKCEGEPVVGQPFTIYLQNVEPKSQLRLTTSQKGCLTGLHQLDDTDVITTEARQVAYKFRTDTEPKPNVWVCVKEPSNGTWVTVPRNGKVGVQGTASDSFSIDSAIGVVVRQPPPTPSPIIERTSFETGGASSGGPLMLFVLFAAAIALVVFAVRAFRRSSHFPHVVQTRRQAGGAAADEDEDGVALKARQEAV